MMRLAAGIFRYGFAPQTNCVVPNVCLFEVLEGSPPLLVESIQLPWPIHLSWTLARLEGAIYLDPILEGMKRAIWG